MKKPVYIDVMVGNNFVCQLRYDKPGFPEIHDGEVIETHREKDIKAFIEEKRPSLRGKPYHVSFSNQRVLNR